MCAVLNIERGRGGQGVDKHMAPRDGSTLVMISHECGVRGWTSAEESPRPLEEGAGRGRGWREAGRSESGEGRRGVKVKTGLVEKWMDWRR